MTILEKITADILAARLAKDKEQLQILITLKGELERGQQKVTSDEDVIKIIRAYLKSLNDKTKVIQNEDYIQKLKNESDTISSYLPPELSYDQLLQLLSEQQFDSIKECMAFVNKYQKEHDILINRSDVKTIYDLLTA